MSKSSGLILLVVLPRPVVRVISSNQLRLLSMTQRWPEIGRASIPHAPPLDAGGHFGRGVSRSSPCAWVWTNRNGLHQGNFLRNAPARAFWRSGHFAHHVVAAKGIRHTHGAFGVIAPLTIDDKEVVVRSQWQFYAGGPDPAAPLFHRD